MRMLTSDLVRVKMRQNQITPVYEDVDDPDSQGLAASLIDLYKTHEGKTLGELRENLQAYVGSNDNLMLCKGLMKLLEDRSEFASASTMEPGDIRAVLFERSARAYESGQFDRATILAESASVLKLSVEELENSLYADLKEMQVLKHVKDVAPRGLLIRYNTALAQAILFKATRLKIYLKRQPAQRMRQLIRAMKFHRLLFEVSGTQETGFEILLEGPLSLFKATQKYGLQMAVFLPWLLLARDWKLEAEVSWGQRRQEKKFYLSADAGLISHYPDRGMGMPEEFLQFAENFSKKESDWRIEPCEHFIELGGQGLLVPDYRFIHKDAGREIFLEIFGFWRRHSLASHLALLKRHKYQDVIVAVSRKLTAEEEVFEDFPGQVCFFNQYLLASDIIKLLKHFA
jgi:predicted nuclease of restriction endonuclease-like RecB superfamily